MNTCLTAFFLLFLTSAALSAGDRADGLYQSGDFIFPVFQPTDRPFQIRGRVTECEKVLVKIEGQPLKTSKDPKGECIAALPETLSGPARVEITASERSGYGFVRFLKISRAITGDLSSNRLQLSVKVKGLEGIDRPITITITNKWGWHSWMQDPGPDSYIPRGWFTALGSSNPHLTVPVGRKVEPGQSPSDVRAFDLTLKELDTSLAQKSPTLTCPVTAHKLKKMTEVERIASDTTQLSIDVAPIFDGTLSPQLPSKIISEWEREVVYQLSAETKRYLISEFDREGSRPNFIELAQDYQGTIHSVSDFERAIIRFYLFDAVKRGPPNHADLRTISRPFSLALFAGDSRDLTYRVSEFFANLRDKYGYVTGWMELDSEPRKMSVEDADSGRFVGATEHAFLFSIGEHHVNVTNGVVSPCAFTLKILPGPNGTRKCIPAAAPVGLH